MLGHDLEMACAKFHENWLIIDGEIDAPDNCVIDFYYTVYYVLRIPVLLS